MRSSWSDSLMHMSILFKTSLVQLRNDLDFDVDKGLPNSWKTLVLSKYLPLNYRMQALYASRCNKAA